MSSHNLRGTAHRQPLICFFSYRFVTLVFKIGFYCISLLILMFYQYMLIIHKMGFNTTFSYMYIMYLDHIQPLFSCSSIPVPLTLFFLPTSFYFHVSFFFPLVFFFFLTQEVSSGLFVGAQGGLMYESVGTLPVATPLAKSFSPHQPLTYINLQGEVGFLLPRQNADGTDAFLCRSSQPL